MNIVSDYLSTESLEKIIADEKIRFENGMDLVNST